ncbi:hypothetical protein EG328_008409 [Venturia inaequalis]|uniref:Uncharacterized protein n=1 Tax=Venturia inaequalis TaxID=5025 RepID=A0A8H3UCQ6_VENIN|nr:hypothetical protein EG328_008409 [Venturia inaequalis]
MAPTTPKKNRYREQAEKLNSKAAPRTLQYHANKAGAKRFKKRYQTKISSKNQKLRKEYGLLHERDTISELWQYIWFTDKAHFQLIKLAEDLVEPAEKVRRQVKEPKQLKYELDLVYQARLKVWQDLKAKELETPKGNCMTQVFYAKNILPIHIQQVQALE